MAVKTFCFIFLFSLGGFAQAGEAPDGSGSDYYAVVLKRRSQDPRTAGWVDAVIFTQSPTYRSVRRLDGDHALTLNAREGRQAEAVTESTGKYCKEIIEENRLYLRLLRDSSGRELCRLYCANDCCASWHRTGAGEIWVEVRCKNAFDALPGESISGLNSAPLRLAQ